MAIAGIPTTLPFAITNIKTLNLDYSRPNKYLVQIFVPSKVPSSNVLTDEVLSLSCQNASFPNHEFTTVEDRRGTPNTQKMPFDMVQQDVTFTFQINSFMTERTVIENWIQYIYNPETDTFAFHDDYVADIHIIQFDQARVPQKHMKLLNAYPITMSEIELGYDMNDQISTFTITFAYERWEAHSATEETIKNAINIVQTVEAFT